MMQELIEQMLGASADADEEIPEEELTGYGFIQDLDLEP